MEPRGHVKAEQFDSMMAVCRDAGFVQLDPPDVGKKRLGALLAVA